MKILLRSLTLILVLTSAQQKSYASEHQGSSSASQGQKKQRQRKKTQEEIVKILKGSLSKSWKEIRSIKRTHTNRLESLRSKYLTRIEQLEHFNQAYSDQDKKSQVKLQKLRENLNNNRIERSCLRSRIERLEGEKSQSKKTSDDLRKRLRELEKEKNQLKKTVDEDDFFTKEELEKLNRECEEVILNNFF